MKGRALFCLFLTISPFLFGASPDPREIVALFGRHLEAVEDYQCRMYEWSVNGRRTEIRYINFYFRKPGLIRMDILEGNRSGDRGSVGVLLEDGMVRGRKGGILSPFALKVDKHSKLATTIRGVTFDESDAAAAYGRLLFLLDNSTVTMTADPGGWLFDCALDEPDDNVTREVLYLSSEILMPLSTESYEGERLVQHVTWRSYIINEGLPEEFFDVRFKAEDLRSMGIQNNLDLPLEKKE